MPLNPTHRTFNIIYSIAFQDSVLLISPILDFSLRCHLLYPTLVYIPVPLNLSPYVCIKPHGLAPHVLYSWDIMWFECYMAEVAVWNGWLIFFFHSAGTTSSSSSSSSVGFVVDYSRGEKRRERHTETTKEAADRGTENRKKRWGEDFKGSQEEENNRQRSKQIKEFQRENQEGTVPGDRHQYYYYLHHCDYQDCYYYKSHNRKSEVLLFSFGGDFLVSLACWSSLVAFCSFFPKKRKRKLLSSCCQYLFVRRLCFG